MKTNKKFIELQGMLLELTEKEILSATTGSIAFYLLKMKCPYCHNVMEKKVARSYNTGIICPQCRNEWEITKEDSEYLFQSTSEQNEIFQHIKLIRELVSPYAKTYEARYKLDTLELYATENSDVPTFQNLMIGLLYLMSEIKFPRETGIRKKLDRYVKSIENTGRGDIDLLRQEEAHR